MQRDLRQRLLSKAVVDWDTGCWIWTASINMHGYGQISVKCSDGKFRPRRAHRVSYQMLMGPIPDGLQLDHLCRNRACINPAHLEPVTNRENTIRGDGPSINSRRLRGRTHCKNNHPFDESNTYIDPLGKRVCRACSREKVRRAEGRSGSQQRTRGRRVVVAQWFGKWLAVGECGHQIPTTNGRQTRSVICRDCDPSYSTTPPLGGAA